jgi:ABC transporter substrate binding protein
VKRREFISMLGGAVIAAPFAATAQRSMEVRRVGVLANEPWPPLEGLRDGIRGLGYVEKQGLQFEYRFAEGSRRAVSRPCRRVSSPAGGRHRRLGHSGEAAEQRGLDHAFVKLSRQRPDAILTVADPFLTSQRTRIASFMIENRLPSMYTYREDVLAGGLISYATNYYDIFRRAAILTDKVLKGAKPADLPIQQPIKFELIINLKTATALGIEIPPTLLARADELIE